MFCREPRWERDKDRAGLRGSQECAGLAPAGNRDTGKAPGQSPCPGFMSWKDRPGLVLRSCPLRVRVQVESITFRVVQPPRHGLIERSGRGQRPLQATTFTMDDIYQNRISYSHDGGSALRDRFTFTVSDGTNPLFVVQDGGRKVREEKGWEGAL